VMLYSSRTGRARDADVTLVGNKVVESYVEQAIFSTPGLDAGYQARLRRLRRNIDRDEKQSVETYRTIAGPAQVRFLQQSGCSAEFMRLRDHGITPGNTNLMPLERNNFEVFGLLRDWIGAHVRG